MAGAISLTNCPTIKLLDPFTIFISVLFTARFFLASLLCRTGIFLYDLLLVNLALMQQLWSCGDLSLSVSVSSVAGLKTPDLGAGTRLLNTVPGRVLDARNQTDESYLLT